MVLKLFVILALLTLFSLADDIIKCPSVLDGNTQGKFDISTQFSNSTIHANWIGLEKNEIISYEWAVVSENKYNTKMKDSCRTSQGFPGVPDTMNWFLVRKLTSAVANNLKLIPSSTYYVVLRTTLANGVQVFSNSNGVLVLPTVLHNTIDTRSQPEKLKTKDLVVKDPLPCVIDEANRCRQLQIPVNELLEKIYGPCPRGQDVIFFTSLPAVVVVDDDDHSTEAGIVAGVIVGVLLLMLCCLLLLGIVALLFAKGDDGGKFNENVVTNRQDHVDADAGTTTSHQLGSDTRVEFPDLDPSARLSVA